jgi:hypothetical protein
MTLYSPNQKDKITKLPHQNEFDLWCQNMSVCDYLNVEGKIRQIFDKFKVGEHTVSSFMPKDWTTKDWEPLYRACRQNKSASGLFFGQIVWRTLMYHKYDWCFYRGDKGNRDYIGLTYYRIEKKTK